MLIKFERPDAAATEAPESESAVAEKEKPENKKSMKAKKASSSGASEEASKEEASKKDQPESHVRVLVRLDFSDHEKLTLQRWLDRIPAEEPFKSAKGEAIRPGNPDFAKTVGLFDSIK